LLKDHPGALHIQTVAPVAYRIQVLMTRHALDRRDAQNRVRTSDRARFDYLRRYHDVNWLDPTLYHLVINTARVPVTEAVNLIIDTRQAIGQAASRDDADAP
jgi:cytidylate kinase